MISWCLPVGDHHDDILTILASSCNLDHLVALALVGSLLNVHLLHKWDQIWVFQTVWSQLSTDYWMIMACLLWLSLVFNLDWLVDQSLAICGLDYLGLALSRCCLLQINSSFLHFYLFLFHLSFTCCWSTICCPAWPPTLPSTWKASKGFR